MSNTTASSVIVSNDKPIPVIVANDKPAVNVMPAELTLQVDKRVEERLDKNQTRFDNALRNLFTFLGFATPIILVAVYAFANSVVGSAVADCQRRFDSLKDHQVRFADDFKLQMEETAKKVNEDTTKVSAGRDAVEAAHKETSRLQAGAKEIRDELAALKTRYAADKHEIA